MTTKIQFQTSRFGAIEAETEDVISFSEGLVGLPDLKSFVLIQHKEGSPFRWMQSLDEGGFALLVVDPAEYAPNFSPNMPESVATSLELHDETPILVYTICTIPNGSPRDMTLNLAGPIVINAESRQARQVILEQDTCPVKYKVFQEEEGQAA